MSTNRFLAFPRPEPDPAPAVRAGAFAFCPVALVPGSWAQQVYEAAYARARAAVEPRRPVLLSLECWN
jgi:hypothetical protein